VSWNVGAGLEGAGVIVTGAAGGIGAEIVRAFDGAGAQVLAVDLDQARADAVIAGLDDPARHRAEGLDLRDLSQHDALLARALDGFGRLDVLVHAAAVAIRRADVDSVSEADWDLQHDINLKGAFFLCRAAGKVMKAQGGGGRIITFTSQAFWTGGFGGSVAYAASKGGIVSMTRGLARTFGPAGITVNAISPGLIDTPMLMDDLPAPLGRIAGPDEIAGTAVFLASSHASYISGATINVSGGFLMY
jgi:NAD(P)-dependent dehydrogenase (short-subunit alcohol dehydrogenase family)